MNLLAATIFNLELTQLVQEVRYQSTLRILHL